MDDTLRFALLVTANHLKDCHFQLQEQMRIKHKWTWVESGQGPICAELTPLLSIILLLERLAIPEPLPPFPSNLGAVTEP